MKALKNNLVVTEFEMENKTESGIILQGNTDTGAKAAVVVSVGDGVVGDLSPGDKIAVDWAKALPVTEDGKKYIILNEDNVHAKYE